MRWLPYVVGSVKLLVCLNHLLLDFLRRLVNLHFFNNLVDLFHVQHFPTIGISLKEQHHGFCPEWVNLVNSVIKHDALDDEVLESLPDEHFLLDAIHGDDVAIEACGLQNQKIF